MKNVKKIIKLKSLDISLLYGWVDFSTTHRYRITLLQPNVVNNMSYAENVRDGISNKLRLCERTNIYIFGHIIQSRRWGSRLSKTVAVISSSKWRPFKWDLGWQCVFWRGISCLMRPCDWWIQMGLLFSTSKVNNRIRCWWILINVLQRLGVLAMVIRFTKFMSPIAAI